MAGYAILDFLTSLPVIRRQIRSYWKRRLRKQIAASPSAKAAFTLIYEEKYWGSGESVSGNGSSAASTEAFRAEFSALIKKLALRSMFDAPCGDFNWMRLVKFPEGFHYIGSDIVDDIVSQCTSKYGSEDREFFVSDFTKDEHPRTGLWLCRDGLLHLSNGEILDALNNFIDSGTEYCLLTNYDYVTENKNIMMGLTRHVNLVLPPFKLPPPRACLEDRPVGEQARKLALWTRDDVAGAIGHLRRDSSTGRSTVQ